jgi:hypothetical protein
VYVSRHKFDGTGTGPNDEPLVPRTPDTYLVLGDDLVRVRYTM